MTNFKPVIGDISYKEFIKIQKEVLNFIKDKSISEKYVKSLLYLNVEKKGSSKNFVLVETGKNIKYVRIYTIYKDTKLLVDFSHTRYRFTNLVNKVHYTVYPASNFSLIDTENVITIPNKLLKPIFK